MRAATIRADRPRTAAGLSCGAPIRPGTELVSATINCMINPPNNTMPIPWEAKAESSPEKMRIAKDMTRGRTIAPPTSPMLTTDRYRRISNVRVISEFFLEESGFHK